MHSECIASLGVLVYQAVRMTCMHSFFAIGPSLGVLYAGSVSLNRQ